METKRLLTCPPAPLSGSAAAHAEGPADHRSPSVDDRSPVRRGIPQLVDTWAAGAVLGRSVNTLKRWRYEGVGPDYVVFQGRVRYDVAVLRDYIAKNTRVPSVRASLEETRGAF
jgi:hypothetical protein